MHEPRRGKFVQGLTPRLIDEIYSLRLLLEPYAVERVIANLDDEGRSRLKRALGDDRGGGERGDERSSRAADVGFHDLMYELADHELLQRAWPENIAGKLRLMSNITTRSLPELADAERSTGGARADPRRRRREREAPHLRGTSRTRGRSRGRTVNC